MATAIVSLSILLQLAAGLYALNLMNYTGRKTGWILLSTALFLMAGRRMLSVYSMVAENRTSAIDITAEVIALTISALLLAGLILSNPLFKKISTSDKEVAESTSKYKILHDTAFAGILTLNTDLDIKENNESAEKIFSVAKGRLTGKNLLSLIPPKYHQRLKAEFETVKSNKSTQPEMFKKHIEGLRGDATFPMDIILSSFVVDGDRLITATIRDISDIIEAQNELQKSKQMLQTILNTIPVRVFWKDTNLNYLGCNDAFAKDAGKATVEEIIGKDDYQMAWKDIAEEYRKDDKQVIDSVEAKLNYEEPIKDDTGKVHWVRTSKIPLIDSDGNIYGVMGVYEDITERKRIEEELLKGQKLESVGLLAGGIAHDFNNLLTAIIGNLFFLKGNNSDPDDIKHIKTIEGAVTRAQGLTKQLMTFSRGGSPVKETISLKGLIMESTEFAMHGSSVTYEHNIHDDIYPVNADSGQISQVLNNILINSIQAMKEQGGGSVYVEAQNTLVTKKDKLLLNDGMYVHISITDSGPGMSPEVRERIFDPFFTTKEGGSGLGLASCYSIIKKHSGNITVSSTLGKGTTFNIYLQAVTDGKPVTPVKESVDSFTLITGTGRILIMDDDNDIRDIFEETLNSIGYDVTLTSEGSEAVLEYRDAYEKDDPYDVVILDLTVQGGMGGKDTAQEILRTHKDAKIIVCSGYSDDPVVADYEKYGFKDRIIKPFKAAELSRVVNKVNTDKTKEI